MSETYSSDKKYKVVFYLQINKHNLYTFCSHTKEQLSLERKVGEKVPMVTSLEEFKSLINKVWVAININIIKKYVI